MEDIKTSSLILYSCSKRANPFELEAYAHDDEADYLKIRVPFAWRSYF